MDRIGILGIGEMGSAVSRRLREHGADVATALDGRSEATRNRAEAAEILDVGSVADLLDRSDLVLSIVESSSADLVARDVSAAISGGNASPPFADLNSVSPMTAHGIRDRIEEAGGSFVDGCIIGGAGNLERASFIFSGQGAPAVATALGRFGLRTEVLGDEAGQASGLKVAYAGMTKGITTLGLELLLLGRSLGILDALSDRYRSTFPDVMRFLEGSLAGYPARAGRRAQEMDELVETLMAEDIDPMAAGAAGDRLRWLADLGLDVDDGAGLEEVLAAVGERASSLAAGGSETR